MTVLECIGLMSLFWVCLVLLYAIYLCISEYVERTIIKYKIRHQYKKKPIAKCYCRDCSKFDPKTGECGDQCNYRLMHWSWFCYFAEPLTGDKFRERDTYIKNKEKQTNE